MRYPRVACAVFGLLASCVQPIVARPPASPPSLALEVLRVHQTATARTVAFEGMAAAAAASDFVFFGEQHDDPETHFVELALLEAIGRLRPHVILSLEMFERDVQPVLDEYLAGNLTEPEFLARARPWERYATDYRPLVMLARARGWKVVAANVPRSIASAVSRGGLAALDTLSPTTRRYAARELSCPRDAYYGRFADEMKGHSAGGVSASPDTAMTNRFYEAQCVKDETMGESIARALAASENGALVVHFDGAFHSDFWQGTVERAMRRTPSARRLVITAVPVGDLNGVKNSEHATRADFIVFTRKPPPK